MADEEDAEEDAPVEPSLDGEDGEGGDGEDDEEGGGGFDAKKIILFVVAPLLILVGVGAGLYFSGMLDKMLGKGEMTEEAHGEGHGAGHGEEAAAECVDDGHGNIVCPGPAFLEVPSIIVNLNSPDGEQRLLRLGIKLELKSEDDRMSVESVMPRVIDQFQTYLRELRVRDLRGSAGIYRMQIELLARVNQAVHPVEVQDVLFQEILIQ